MRLETFTGGAGDPAFEKHCFVQMRAANARIVVSIIQGTARWFAVKFRKTGFLASSNQFEKYELRPKISQEILCGESSKIPVEISSSWNNVQSEAIRKCLRKGGCVKDDVKLRPDSPTRDAEIEGADFDDFVAIDDEVATSTEPDPQAIFQFILDEAGMSVEASSAGDDAEKESDSETEMVQKLNEEHVGCMLTQLKCFAA
ncbi:hypothetical protein TTRE_0000728301 [Trichuris trichiura]|uniref:Uncharacterized protein n=1 Tax=Trichuris trichiura TaxID=36087 RepID=A0A077ZGL0_TRITR|nr:hypothetical protein TTRE_0000728301 [Trichuris trichiura]